MQSSAFHTALVTSGSKSPPGIQVWVLSLSTVDSTCLSDPSLRTLGYTESNTTHVATGHRTQKPFHQQRDQGCDRSVWVPSEPPSEQGCKRRLSQQPEKLALEYPETTTICPEPVNMSLASSVPLSSYINRDKCHHWTLELLGAAGREHRLSHPLCLLHTQGPDQTILTGGGAYEAWVPTSLPLCHFPFCSLFPPV